MKRKKLKVLFLAIIKYEIKEFYTNELCCVFAYGHNNISSTPLLPREKTLGFSILFSFVSNLHHLKKKARNRLQNIIRFLQV